MPSRGRTPPLCTDAASSVPTNGPTQANEVSENVSPMSSVPSTPPFCEARSRLVRIPDGNGDLEGAQQAQSEHEKHQRDETVHPRVRAQLHDAERPEQRRGRETHAGEQHDDAEAEDDAPA